MVFSITTIERRNQTSTVMNLMSFVRYLVDSALTSQYMQIM